MSETEVLTVIEALGKQGYIITTAKQLAELVSKEISKFHAKELSRTDACQFLGISKSSFERLEKDPNTQLRRTYKGGRGRNNQSRYLTASVELEKRRLSNK